MNTPLSPSEQLLTLADQFTRHNDALGRLGQGLHRVSTAFTDQIDVSQRLANTALDVRDDLLRRQIYRSSGVRAAITRISQLGQLATDAAELLLNAVDMLDEARGGCLIADEGLIYTYQDALKMANSSRTLAVDLTSLGADDCVATAEMLDAEMRRQHITPAQQPPALSPAQTDALRAVARGYVTINRPEDKPFVSHDDVRVTISTIRSLESRGLVVREECARLPHDERVHLTREGCRGLAAAFGRPQPSHATPARAVPAPAKTPAGRTR